MAIGTTALLLLVYTIFWVQPEGVKYETLYSTAPYETVEDCREAAAEKANWFSENYPGGHSMFKCVYPPAPVLDGLGFDEPDLIELPGIPS